ncbi:unnamed protein product [Peronospora farinosa]|uniref:HSF-type DNA-binding domain-containing protein n=1 Tax=Peronospora farinosa TaxID=134698 RepID=A0ABN8C0I1_9STRA|nr:unnamed protein product [Peronospora farinosa]
MAKRIRMTKQEDAVPTSTGLTDGAKTLSSQTSSTTKNKTVTATNIEGKHVMLPAFLSKTYEIFSMPEFAHVCGWNATGDTIIVSQLEAFVSMVLPRFFKHRNFPSFVRQLNLYGFHKTVLDSKRLEFQHPYFKRSQPDLLHHIKRKISNSNHHNQQLVSASIQNSRLDAHREMSDALLREMKELRQRSDAMEKRLRDVEIDNAIVRSDNLKLWKHLEAAKDKQLVMHEKMKKIMWILFQIYRGKQQNLPKLSSNDVTGAVISDDYTNSSMLGPKEFRDVLRFLAMDEPPMLPESSSANVATVTPGSRKRKFVEGLSDVGEVVLTEKDAYELGMLVSLFCVVIVGAEELTMYFFGKESSLAFGSPSSAGVRNPFTMNLLSSPSPSAHLEEGQNNVLSIFSPITAVNNSPVNKNIDSAPGGFLTNGVDTTLSAPVLTESTPTKSVPPVTATTPTESIPDVGTLPVSNGSESPSVIATASSSTSTPDVSSQLAFLDEDLPLLPDSDYNFTDGEQTVMKKLEDFETSLLDEYDVSCLDTLLLQLKNGGGDKPLGVSVADPENVVVGPTNSSSHDA